MAKLATLQDMIREFVDSLGTETDGRTIANRWRAELRQHAERTPATRKLYVSKYRNAIRAKLGAEAIALKYVRHNTKESGEIRQAYKARIALSHRSLVGMPRWQEMVDHAASLARTGTPIETAIASALLTGRRTIEVCVTGWVSRRPADNGVGFEKWAVLFEGQAKTREAEGTQSGKAYRIPVLAPAALVIEAWQRMRASEPGSKWALLNSDEFTSTGMHTRLVEACIRAFSPFWPKNASIPLSPKALRALYAEIAYKHFAKQDVSKSAFFADILGHQRWDLETSLSYFDFYIDDPKSAADAVVSGQDELIKAAQERGDEWAAKARKPRPPTLLEPAFSDPQ